MHRSARAAIALATLVGGAAQAQQKPGGSGRPEAATPAVPKRRTPGPAIDGKTTLPPIPEPPPPAAPAKPAAGPAAPTRPAAPPAKTPTVKPAAPPARAPATKATTPVTTRPTPPAPQKPEPLEKPEGPELPSEKAILTDCPAKIPPGKKFKWDLRGEIDLQQLVQWASATLCRPVIVPQNLRQQKVTIYAPGLIYAEEAQRLFFSALTSMGLTVQPQGPKGREMFTIIESNRSHELVPFVGPGERPPTSDQFITKLVRLKNIGTDEIVQVLNRLKTKDGDIVPFGPAGTLIMTDTAENLRRMEEIITQLDHQPLGAEKIWVVKLHNTAASEMAALLDKVFQTKQQPGQPAGRPSRVNLSTQISAAPVTTGGPTAPGVQPESPGAPQGQFQVSQIIPEDRSNTLIIVANERAYAHILALIKRLDQQGGPLDNAADRIHVYFLANANADEMAQTLGGLGIGVAGARGRTGARGTAAPAAGTPGQAGALFESEVKIAADKPTNSLVIVASGRDYLTVRDLIRKLDIARRQVFIEATILEVSLDKARKIGLALHGGTTVGSGDSQSLVFGGLQPNSQVNSILFSPAALTGLAAGLRGPPIPGADRLLGLPPGQSIPAFGVFLQLLQNNNDVNVVSMPHVLTSDNEKATIQVGRNLPFPGTFGGFPGLGAIPGAAGAAGAAGLGGFGGFGTSVQRQDVALKMDVTPHVNDSDFVRLEIDNEISDVASENFNGLGPATDKRTVKTVVVVRDQQSVVLGGLVKDRIAESVDKVPLLGDIPILGYLFKFTRKTVLKQNLLIVLTPYVIKDPLDLRRIFERKIRERKEFLERYSAFEDTRSYDPTMDYTRKRGLLEEINRTAIEAETEGAELRAAEAAVQERFPEGPVEPLPMSQIRGKNLHREPPPDGPPGQKLFRGPAPEEPVAPPPPAPTGPTEIAPPQPAQPQPSSSSEGEPPRRRIRASEERPVEPSESAR